MPTNIDSEWCQGPEQSFRLTTVKPEWCQRPEQS